MMQDLDTLQDLIERVLEKHRDARGSYKMLVARVWYYQTGNKGFLSFSPRQLELMSSSEAITRTARRLRYERPDLAAPVHVQEMRQGLREEYRAYFGGASVG